MYAQRAKKTGARISPTRVRKRARVPSGKIPTRESKTEKFKKKKRQKTPTCACSIIMSLPAPQCIYPTPSSVIAQHGYPRSNTKHKHKASPVCITKPHSTTNNTRAALCHRTNLPAPCESRSNIPPLGGPKIHSLKSHSRAPPSAAAICKSASICRMPCKGAPWQQRGKKPAHQIRPEARSRSLEAPSLLPAAVSPTRASASTCLPPPFKPLSSYASLFPSSSHYLRPLCASTGPYFSFQILYSRVSTFFPFFFCSAFFSSHFLFRPRQPIISSLLSSPETSAAAGRLIRSNSPF